MSALLQTTAVNKQFGGLAAVTDLNVRVDNGEIIGLIGPNGAGKTTSFNLITGVYTPTSGKVEFAGQDITGMKPHRIAKLGVARTFQNIRLFREMSVLENVMVAQHMRMGTNQAKAFVKQDQSRAVPMHLRNAPTRLMKDLGHGQAYRYAHNEPDAYAAGESYFPDGLPQRPGWYRPVARGLELQIAQKLQKLRELDDASDSSSAAD